MNIEVVLLSGILVLLMLFAACSFLLFLSISAVFRRVKSDIIEFVTPPAEDKPSRLSKTIDAVAISFGRAIAAQVKTTLLGARSGIVRGEKAIQGEMAIETAEQTPMLSSLLGSFPGLRGSLRKRPELIDIALALGNKLGIGVGGSPESGNHSEQNSPKFQL